MLTFKQRYKPRTTREYTKSDLTVYDSAGNTALNALTVYGKSEVVDGSIKSAGEGWSVVRLANLTWLRFTGNPNFFYAVIPNAITTGYPARGICNKYSSESSVAVTNKCFTFNGNQIRIRDDDYTTVSDFIASLGDATLCYQLADPTQGNAIAVKTDNGSGINGTMAVFETGTPLYGVSDTVRDVMTWDGSSGVVTKNCDDINLGDYTWHGSTGIFYIPISQLQQVPKPAPTNNIEIPLLCDKYPTSYANDRTKKMIAINSTSDIVIYDSGYTNPADLKTDLSGVHLIYPTATPTITPLTTAENASIAGLRTFDGTTHFTINAVTDMTVNYTIRVPTI